MLGTVENPLIWGGQEITGDMEAPTAGLELMGRGPAQEALTGRSVCKI